jgi:hypothetical protein
MVKLAVTLVLVESKTFQVALAVMSTEPGSAVAVKGTALPVIDTLWELGDTVIEVTSFKTTVTEVEPLHDEQPPDDAVMLADPI